MTETVAVIISTYGDRLLWNNFAKRALRSVTEQTRQPDEVVRIHRDTLVGTRNDGASMVKTDWLCFLDADDALERDYLQAMMDGAGELRYPLVRFVQECSQQVVPPPKPMPKKPIFLGNYMLIGTLIERELFLRIGGFPNYPAYEDWALWIKAYIAGARSNLITKAIYRAYERPQSRNHVDTATAMQLCRKIVADFEPYARAKGLDLRKIL